ncbi:MAG: hypothetical protein NTW73_03070 [Candidatus Parcubacteria bacterium]|nr:hypothetical protein [Candidatus Parcubacteria bacterium]
MKVYYITENKRKIERAKKICQNTNIEIEQIQIDTPEIQGVDSSEIVQYSVKFAGEKLDKPIIKLDVSFHINALNGFPGPFIKYINQWLEPEYILKMLEGVKDRSCYWIDSLAFYNKGQIKVFTAKEEGTIADEVRGENGWGMDKIFILKGQIKTKAELSDEERIEICNKGHWAQFIRFMENNGY